MPNEEVQLQLSAKFRRSELGGWAAVRYGFAEGVCLSICTRTNSRNEKENKRKEQQSGGSEKKVS